MIAIYVVCVEQTVDPLSLLGALARRGLRDCMIASCVVCAASLHAWSRDSRSTVWCSCVTV